MKILLLGGFGYIGSTLTKYLLENTEHKITVIDRLDFEIDQKFLHDMINHDRLTFVHHDIMDLSKTFALINNHDAIVYLAALTLPNSALNPDEAFMVNQYMAEIVFDLCQRFEKSFCFMSTCSNYGKSEKPVDEEGELFPVSVYAISKVNAEKYMLRKKFKKLTILRCATAYGISPGRTRWDVLVNDFVKAAIEKKIIDIFQPQAHRPVCHILDISQAIKLVIERKEDQPQVYNVGSNDQNYTKNELAEYVAKCLNAEITLVEKEDNRDYQVDFGKISKDLGFKCTKKVNEEMIKEISDKLS